ncbi:P-loop containing nucleoside triphosphate hydrolase protein [Rhypophila decipiens]
MDPLPSRDLDMEGQPGTANQFGDRNRMFPNFGESQKNIEGSSYKSGGGVMNIVNNINRVSAEERAETPPAPFAIIPFSRDPDFVNRGGILDQIYGRCSEPAGRVSLVGLGGVGKSQLAIECAYRVAAEQTNKWIFWIHAGTQARVEEGFRTIADAVKLPGRNHPKADIPQLVYSWLSNERNGGWVIVLDSADDSDVFYSTTGPTPKSKPLATYLPQSRNGAILVTTRNKNLARRLTGNDANILDVGPMVEADALSLLKKKLGLPDIDRATELVRVLEYVPLAISQAAGYIRAGAPRSSPEKYLDEFRAGERKRIKLLRHDGGDLRRDGSASNAILTTWQISFEHICSKRPSATDLLSLMSFFDRQGISESLLKDSDGAQGVKSNKKLEAGESESEDDCNNAEDMFEDDVAMLQDYCLVSTNEAGDVFEMHGLVQLSTRKWLEARGLQEKFKAQFVKRMAMSFPTGDYSNWVICRRLFVHVEKAMGCRPADGEMEEVWARLLYNGGWYALLQGQYEIAERMVDKARRTREKRLGREDEASLQSVLLYASVMKARGRWKEAESLDVQVMETSSRVLGEEHPDTLTSMANLAKRRTMCPGTRAKWSVRRMIQLQNFGH